MISKIPFTFIKIEDRGFHLLINVLINNKNANLLIDTGASKTVFDLNRIQPFLNNSDLTDNEMLSTGLGTNTLTSKSTKLESFKIGEFEINNYPCIIIDMNHINETYQSIGLEPFDGVLGSDILYKFKAAIDFKTKTLKLREKNK